MIQKEVKIETTISRKKKYVSYYSLYEVAKFLIKGKF